MSGEDTCILAAIQSVVMLGVEVSVGTQRPGLGGAATDAVCRQYYYLSLYTSQRHNHYDLLHLCHTLTLNTNFKICYGHKTTQLNIYKNIHFNVHFMYSVVSLNSIIT